MGRCDRGFTIIVASTGRCLERGIINTDAPPSFQEGIDRRPVLTLWITRETNYRPEFDKTVRKRGEDPSNFAITLETLAVEAFGNMGQTARLRLIRDRFIAGHESCDLRRYLDCVPPDTPLRDIVDRCRWESHADPEVRRISKPMPEPVYPTYVVKQPDYETTPTLTVAYHPSPRPPRPPKHLTTVLPIIEFRQNPRVLKADSTTTHAAIFLVQRTNHTHIQRVRSGSQLWLSEPIPK